MHTVGPVWNGGNKKERELLGNCYHNSLRIANELNLATIAFPNISTGIYGFPKQEAAEIAIQTVQEFLRTDNKTIQEVVFICFDEENYEIYQHLEL
ncbi:macro domain-containing protein [Emticicia sp. BO119]|uniref:macro domain-containing protein n=1 Tax=Emticicia sp. BO119 TaxID=2757768 RepID=UPI0038D4A9B0